MEILVVEPERENMKIWCRQAFSILGSISMMLIAGAVSSDTDPKSYIIRGIGQSVPSRDSNKSEKLSRNSQLNVRLHINVISS